MLNVPSKQTALFPGKNNRGVIELFNNKYFQNLSWFVSLTDCCLSLKGTMVQTAQSKHIKIKVFQQQR